MRLFQIAFAGTVAAALIAGCARTPVEPARPRAAGSAAARPITPPPATPAAYVAAAASIDLFAIRSAELALRRSTLARHREFASMMLAAHRGTSAQLSFAGRRLNLLPSTVLMPRHRALLAGLESSGSFDRSYRQSQIAVHREALQLHENFARTGRSATLRPVAAAAGRTVRRHLVALQSL